MNGIDSLIRNLSVLVSFIFFGGLIYIISYYTEFGFRYSELNIQYYHILYRGIALVFNNIAGFILLIILLISLIIPAENYRLNIKMKPELSSISRGVVILSFPLIYIIAAGQGFKGAQRDSSPTTTSLRELVYVKSGDQSLLPAYSTLLSSLGQFQTRVFVVQKSKNHIAVIAVSELSKAGAVKPTVHTLLLRSGDNYADKESNNHRSFWRALF